LRVSDTKQKRGRPRRVPRQPIITYSPTHCEEAHTTDPLIDRLQLAYQRLLLPQRKTQLICPIFTLRAKLQIKAVQHTRHYELHLGVCHTVTIVSAKSSYLTSNRQTYFWPKQSRDPTENGCKAALLSFANRSSPSQRSGRKDNGSLKFFSDRKQTSCGTRRAYCANVSYCQGRMACSDELEY
jgi:hypothetical protein